MLTDSVGGLRVLILPTNCQSFFLDILQPVWERCHRIEEPVSPVFWSMELTNVPGFRFVNFPPLHIEKLMFLACQQIQGIPEWAMSVAPDLLLEALVECKRVGELSSDYLVKQLAIAIEARSREPMRCFDCFFVTDLPSCFLAGVGRPVFGHRAQLCQWEDAIHLLGGIPTRIWQGDRAKIPLGNATDYRIVQIAVSARTGEEAFFVAWSHFSLLRAVANLSQPGETVLCRSGEVEPVARFRQSPLMAVRGGDMEPINKELLIPIPRDPSDEVAWRGLDDALRITSAFPAAAVPEGHSAKRLCRAFQAFGASLDEINPSYRFLGLWQTIEILANTASKDGRSGDTEQICKRVANLFTEPERKHIRPCLNAMAPIRNRLVHDGEFVDRFDEACYWMQRVAGDILRRYASLSLDLPTDQHFLTYFELCTCSLKPNQSDTPVRCEVKEFLRVLRAGKATFHPRLNSLAAALGSG